MGLRSDLARYREARNLPELIRCINWGITRRKPGCLILVKEQDGKLQGIDQYGAFTPERGSIIIQFEGERKVLTQLDQEWALFAYAGCEEVDSFYVITDRSLHVLWSNLRDIDCRLSFYCFMPIQEKKIMTERGEERTLVCPCYAGAFGPVGVNQYVGHILFSTKMELAQLWDVQSYMEQNPPTIPAQGSAIVRASGDDQQC